MLSWSKKEVVLDAACNLSRALLWAQTFFVRCGSALEVHVVVSEEAQTVSLASVRPR
jgi:hypothetical protein